jgi:type II secretory ATPase GspE/PulE/Tfp pilus assembly ATPase PilB-like protein
MELAALTELMAQVPDSFVFISPWKLPIVVVLFAIWAAFAQWVDKDALAVNTYRSIWNMIVIGVGVIALACLLLIPMFWVGFAVFFVVVGGNITAYAIHRNGLVRDEDKVFTPAHIARKLSEVGGKKKEKKKEVKMRVQLRAADGAKVGIPDDNETRERFALAQDLLFDMAWHRVKRAEIAPTREQARVAYEIDGIVKEREPLSRPDADAIILYLKQLAGLSLEERRKPQTGRIKANMGPEHQVEIDVKTAGSTAGEKMSLVVIGEEVTWKIGDLGLTDKQLDIAEEVKTGDKGLVLLSAPKGEGLSTTVYSFARSHDAFLFNIQTLEYDIEQTVHNITQRSVNVSENKTFSGELQRLFRADPDIVILPEIRDQASAVMATEAAGRKQLVYAALNASDAVSALGKWLELVNDNGKVASALEMVTNQRLVRKLCPACKQAYKPDPGTLKKLNMPKDTVLHRVPEPEYDKRGEQIICQACQGTNYVGRTAIFEVLRVTPELEKVIRSAKSLKEIQAHVAKLPTTGLQKQALQKVLDGTTSIDEIRRVLSGNRTSSKKRSAKPAAKQAAKPA